MTRTLKFRAWTGQMQYDIMVGRFGIFYVNPGEKGDGLDVKDTASLTQFNTKIDEKSCQIMQFTGFLDKNGKEIYEGDIVNFGDAIHKIVFDRGCFYMEDSSEPETVPYILDIKYHQMASVIGNIYENPELLQNAK